MTTAVTLLLFGLVALGAKSLWKQEDTSGKEWKPLQRQFHKAYHHRYY